MADKEEAEKGDPSALLTLLSAEEKDLGNLSGQDFAKGCYISCIQHLLKLVGTRPKDPKVLHNKAVVEYYLSDFKRTDEFRKNLQSACSQVGVSLEDVDGLDDVEHCVYYYNQAVILYHLRQHTAALAILDKVFQFVEPLEETLARNICFLLLELYLCTGQPEKALGMVEFMENILFDKQRSDSSDKVNPQEKDGEHSKNSEKKESSNVDEYKLELQQQKTRCYLMLRSLKGCKRELKQLSTLGGPTPATVFFKANLEYLKGSWRKAMKVLNTVSAPPRTFAETGENLPVYFYNNIGCIHFHLGRYNLGCFYFQKALQENDNTIKQMSKADHGANFRYEILYNLGIQLLYAKKPLEAFDCLIEVVQVYHTNPCLWLRLAECCIQVHKLDNEADFHLRERKKDIVLVPVGTGVHRKIILAPHINKPHHLSQEVHLAAMPLPTLEFSAICLRNALLLLPEESGSMATPSTSEPETESNPIFDSSTLTSVQPGNPIRPSEVSLLRCSVLASSAYVSLCIGDIVMALHYADTLLSQPKLSGVHRLLGHLYAGEAMILLDNISSAIQHLNPASVKDFSFSFQPSEKEEKDKSERHGIADENTSQDIASNIRGWFPNSAPVARMIMQYNLTVAYTICGELDKASETLRQLDNLAKSVGAEIPVQALMLAMYIQMQLGHADYAKKIIKQHCPQYR